VASKAKYYSAAFRANAVRLAAESDRPITEVARDLGIKYNQLYSWMKTAGKTKQIYDRRLPPPPPVPPPETAEDEVRRLRRELDEVKMERDFLKKAAAFFAKMNK
jgi:transposase